MDISLGGDIYENIYVKGKVSVTEDIIIQGPEG